MSQLGSQKDVLRYGDSGIKCREYRVPFIFLSYLGLLVTLSLRPVRPAQRQALQLKKSGRHVSLSGDAWRWTCLTGRGDRVYAASHVAACEGSRRSRY